MIPTTVLSLLAVLLWSLLPGCAPASRAVLPEASALRTGASPPDDRFTEVGALTAEEVPLVLTAGVYTLPVTLNGVLLLQFILDTGASEVTIPEDVASILVRTGTIQETDFLPGGHYVLADGTPIQSPRFLLRRLQIGRHQLADIPASIGTQSSFPLLGQSVLQRFGVWGIDNQKKALVLGAALHARAAPAHDRLRSLTGQWQGSWRSTEAPAHGTVAVTFQQAELALHGGLRMTASPCFTAGVVYGTVMSDTIVLRVDFGKSQWADLAGALDAQGHLIEGYYQVNGGPCGGDQGVWGLQRE